MSGARTISVGLLWHATAAGNLGVGALTVGNLIAAKAAAEALGLSARFTIMEPASDLSGAYVTGDDIDVFRIDRRSMLSPAGYWALLGKLDCILDIGAGDSFTDIYGAKRFAFMFATKELARVRRVPLLFSPQTIGPFTRQPYKALAAHAMNGATAVLARDPASMAAISKLAPRARRIQSVDVAFKLPFERPARTPGGPLEIGVNVSGLLFNERGAYGMEVDYAELMRRFIAEQSGRKDARVHLICHVLSERIARDDDGRVADRLAAEFPNVVRAPDFLSPSAAKSYISGLDFLTGGRMHACIAAYSSGVPVVPIAYSRKFSGLFEGILSYGYQIPVKGMGTDAALAYLNECLRDRAELGRAIARGMTVVDAALAAYDTELRRLFSVAFGRRPPGARPG